MTTGQQPAISLKVECYAGYRADEAPRRFFLGSRAVAVSEIIDRWLDPAASYFKLRGDDGGVEGDSGGMIPHANHIGGMLYDKRCGITAGFLQLRKNKFFRANQNNPVTCGKFHLCQDGA